MKYLFILGRNIALSVEEIKSFFRKNGFNFKQEGLFENGLLVETNFSLPKETIERLGGTISIGEVITSGKINEIVKGLDKNNLCNVSGNKLNYILHDFDGEKTEDISSYLKTRFRGEGLKATEKKPTGNIHLQSGGIIRKTTSKLIDEEYFVFENHFGRIIQISDYEDIEKRDMNKPVRRNELSISPRLAKILINLSEVHEGDVLLDPFCGIGVVLEEAIHQKIKAIGIDKSKEAIAGARTNLKWFGFNEGQYRLMNDDSSKVKLNKVSGIATEPELGTLQKKIPTPEEAKKIAAGFEDLMIRVLRNLKENVKGRIVFTSPLILAGRTRIACNIERISQQAGLKLLLSIPEFRESSIVGRTIAVMEK